MPADLTDDAVAAARAARYASEDPLPLVPCSLLGSAEIYEYAHRTGMLCPFFARSLKSASYEAHIGGRFIWWDGRGVKHDRPVERGNRCVLPANSITFVQVEPQFRLPNYIAVRFNLRITHVHRGLLLGTGPLVDPGFEGRLLIPLHNLTSTDYQLNTEDALIWIEFTKTSFRRWPTEPFASVPQNFYAFPENKKNKDPDYYLSKANDGEPIRSSIPGVINDARRAARRAERLIFGIGFVVFLGVVIALAALYFQVYSVVQSSVALSQGFMPVAQDVKAANERLNAAQDKLNAMRTDITDLRREIGDLRRARIAPKASPPVQPRSVSRGPTH